MSVLRVFLVIIVGAVLTYAISIAEDASKGFIGSSGLPLRFTSSSGLLGGAQMNYPALFVDVLFWSAILVFILKLIKR
jgi:hypothetical protein